MEPILRSLLGQDNQARKEGEAALLSGVKARPEEAVASLLELCCGASDQGVRLLSAMLLRKFVGGASVLFNAWPLLGEQSRAQCKTQILQLLTLDMPQNMRTQVQLCISDLAQKLIPENQWNDFLQTLTQGLSDSRPAVRGSILTIFASIFSELAEGALREHIPALLQIYKNTLEVEKNEQSTVVCLAAVEGILEITTMLDDEEEDMIRDFSALLPSILEILVRSVGDAGRTSFTLEVIDSFTVACQEQKSILHRHQPQLIGKTLEFFVGVAFGGGLDERVECAALELVLAVCDAAPAKVAKLQNFIATLLPKTAEYLVAQIDAQQAEATMQDWSVTHFLDDEDFLHTFSFVNAKFALQRIADCLSVKQTYTHLQAVCSTYFSKEAWQYRVVALTCLSQMAEGLTTYMKKDLKHLTGVVLQHLTHPHPYVRVTAVECCYQFCIDFKAFTRDYQSEVVPALAALCSTDPHPRIQARTCTAVSMFYMHAPSGACDAMFAPLLKHLLEVLQHNYTKYPPHIAKTLDFVKTGAMSALTDVIGNASKGLVVAEYANLLGIIIATLQTANANARDLHINWNKLGAECLDCLAKLAERVGKEVLRGDVEQIMGGLAAVLADLQRFGSQEDIRIEALLRVFGVFAEVLGADFAPYLHIVLPTILLRVNATECEVGSTLTFSASEDAVLKNQNSTIVSEKADALSLLGDICSATGAVLPDAQRNSMLEVLYANIQQPAKLPVFAAAFESLAKFLDISSAAATFVGPTLLDQSLQYLLQHIFIGESVTSLVTDIMRTICDCVKRENCMWITPQHAVGLVSFFTTVLQDSSNREDKAAEDERCSIESDEEDSDDEDEEAETKLQHLTAIAMETLLVKQPHVREAAMPLLAEAFLSFISDTPNLRELGFSGSTSLLEKGYTVFIPQLLEAVFAYIRSLSSKDVTALETYGYECISSACASIGTVAVVLVSSGALGAESAGFASAANGVMVEMVRAFLEAKKKKHSEMAACVTYACWALMKLSVLQQALGTLDPQALYTVVLSAAPLSGKCFDCKDHAVLVHDAIADLNVSTLNPQNRALLQTAVEKLKKISKDSKVLSKRARAHFKNL